jgi:hypothetical protein
MKYSRERTRKLIAFVKDNPLMKTSEVAARMQCDKKYVYYARYRAGVTGDNAKLAHMESLKNDKNMPTKQIPIKLTEPKPITTFDPVPAEPTAAFTAASIEIARLNTIIKYLEKRLAAYGSPI